jgi:phage gp46-like protein
MPDIRLVQNTTFPKYSVTVDWLLLDDGTLDDTQALATAVIVALGTDRLADPNDFLPDPDSADRRGWWGDFDAQLWDGWPIGTRLWLLTRDKIVGPAAQQGATEARVREYIIEALQPFVDRRIASRFYVETTRVGRERIDALIRMYRGPEAAIDLRFQILWTDMVESGGTFNIGQPLNPL